MKGDDHAIPSSQIGPFTKDHHACLFPVVIRRSQMNIICTHATSSVIASALIVFASTAGTHAEVRRVPNDYPTIQAAVSASIFGDEVHVSSSGSPYEEKINAEWITILGGYSPDFQSRDPKLFETIIQMPDGGVGTLVGVTGGVANVFDGFTITGGNEAFVGGGMQAHGSLTISNCKFIRNRAYRGGGLLLTSPVTVRQCLFEQNTAIERGGGILSDGSDALIDLCTVQACTSGADPGGGGLCVIGPARLHRNTIRQNYSYGDGGGLHASGGGKVHGWANLFLENQAEGNGGGIYHASQSSGEVRHVDTLVEDCVAGVDGSGSGGGVYTSEIDRGSFFWHDGFIRGNSAIGSSTDGLGGGIYLQGYGAFINGAEIAANSASKGGGVYMTQGQVDYCTIALNASSDGNGGGIHVSNASGSWITHNVISHQLDGHGIASEAPYVPVISGNDVFNLDSENPDSEYGLNCSDQTGTYGNIREDPQFCDLTTDPPDLAVQSTSPVFQGNNHMGAHDASIACGTISVEELSWGRIKSLYR
jgi:predicted outer membrane repeat protein